jgi:curli biogenesis system outer membrane secretion channel CsgG
MKKRRFLGVLVLTIAALTLTRAALAQSATATCCGTDYTQDCPGCSTASASCSFYYDLNGGCHVTQHGGNCSGCID